MHQGRFSPHTQRMLFLSIIGLFGLCVGCTINDHRSPKALSDLQTGTDVQLTTGTADHFYPVWSPDGQQIAFVSTRSGNWDIWIMNRDGSDQQPLTTYSGLDTAPAWSPDGTLIAFASTQLNLQGVAQLWLMGLDGTNPQPVGSRPHNKQLFPAWSPSGRELAFIAEPMNEPAHLQLQRIDVHTATIRTLAKEHVSFAASSWHPDGKRIAFVRTPRQKKEIWTITPEGRDPQPLLADQANNSDPQWSPDGTRLAFRSDRSGSQEIWLLNLTTRQLQQLSFHRSTAGFPNWHPQGHTIAFTSNRSGSDQIWIISSLEQ